MIYLKIETFLLQHCFISKQTWLNGWKERASIQLVFLLHKFEFEHLQEKRQHGSKNPIVPQIWCIWLYYGSVWRRSTLSPFVGMYLNGVLCMCPTFNDEEWFCCSSIWLCCDAICTFIWFSRVIAKSGLLNIAKWSPLSIIQWYIFIIVYLRWKEYKFS